MKILFDACMTKAGQVTGRPHEEMFTGIPANGGSGGKPFVGADLVAHIFIIIIAG